MDFKELSKLDMAALKEREQGLRKEMMDMRFEAAVGKLLNTAAPKQRRVDLARVLTRQKQLEMTTRQ